MSKLPEVFVSPELKTSLLQGHPWIYRNQITAPPPKLADGTWVQVRCANFSAIGLWDSTSQIAVRIFSRSKIPDAAWLKRQINQAWENRALLREPELKTNAYRWLFGEADGLPGITVDLYGQYAVIQTYAGSLNTLKQPVSDILSQIAPLKGILERGEREEGKAKSRLLWGSLPPRNLVIEENGLRFRANLFEGQKTGLFLDHRDNRHYLERWCAGKTVLNCFSYTGAFSVYAARGGAYQITSCDIASQASEEAIQNFRLNGFDPEQHEFLSEDCFELLNRYATEGRKFDLVILDPPSFAHAKKNVYAALRGYSRLNQLALKVLKEGGLLASASCTSYVSPENFKQMLGEAAASVQKRLFILHEAGQPLDHPVPAHFMEGRYLKFVLARVQGLQ
jgi:23S rRNA (cytosine1962-C5)-methyltransferase